MRPLVSTLIELQRLKRLERTGWMLRGLPLGTESVAAHSFGVAVTTMLLADELIARGEQLDVEKLLRIALLHDWAEARVGDIPKTGTQYLGVETRRQAELAAFRDIVGGFASVENVYQTLHDDYEQRKSPEAQLVKAADVIDLLVQVLALERAGSRGLDEFWEVAEERQLELTGMSRQVVDEILDLLIKARTQTDEQAQLKTD
jgi:putative hydrolase of HD superfamily